MQERQSTSVLYIAVHPDEALEYHIVSISLIAIAQPRSQAPPSFPYAFSTLFHTASDGKLGGGLGMRLAIAIT